MQLTDDDFIEALLSSLFRCGSRRELHEGALLLRHDRDVADLAKLVEVVPATNTQTRCG